MWPWDWIKAAGSALSGLSQKAVDWVNQLIASVMSWVTDAVNSIWRTISSIWDDIAKVWDNVVSFVTNLVNDVWRGISTLTNQVFRWIADGVNQVWQYAKGAYEWAEQEIGRVSTWVTNMFEYIYTWVKQNVYDPLVKLYDDVKNWVIQTFNQVWQYIQHPELLIKLIGGALMHLWMQYVRQFALVFVRWIINAMKSMAGEVFDLLESVLSNII